MFRVAGWGCEEFTPVILSMQTVCEVNPIRAHTGPQQSLLQAPRPPTARVESLRWDTAPASCAHDLLQLAVGGGDRSSRGPRALHKEWKLHAKEHTALTSIRQVLSRHLTSCSILFGSNNKSDCKVSSGIPPILAAITNKPCACAS